MNLLKNFSILLFFVISFVSCTDFKNLGKEFINTNANNIDFDKIPNMEFYGFRRESYDTNFKQLDSFATNAKFFNDKKKIELYESRSYTYESNKTIAASISGEFVLIDQDTLYTQIYTNVIAKSSNNTIIYT